MCAFCVGLHRVVFGHVRPAEFLAGVAAHRLILIRGAAGDAVGADHLVADEDRRAAARDVDLTVGQHRGVHEELRIAFLEPLLDHEAVLEARADRAPGRDRERLGLAMSGDIQPGVVHPLDREDVALTVDDGDRDRGADFFGLFGDGLDELAAIDRA